MSWYLQVEAKARHGRRELRAIWALTDPELNAYVGSSGTHGTAWPHLAQLILVERHPPEADAAAGPDRQA